MLAHRLLVLGTLHVAESCWTHAAFVGQRRVHLPPLHKLSADNESIQQSQSVTGPIYEMSMGPSVKLFTKQGCTLCDKVKDVCMNSWLIIIVL